MRIKLLAGAFATAAMLAVGVGSASAASVDMQYLNGGTWTSLPDQTRIDASLRTSPATLSAGWGTIDCTSSSLAFYADRDGSVDHGDVESATFGGCTADIFFNTYNATVSSTAGGCTLRPVTGGWTGATSFSINNICVHIAIPDLNCRMEVGGGLSGTWTDGTANSAGNTGRAQLVGASGLVVTAENGNCPSVDVNDPADFTGDYNVRKPTNVAIRTN